jgi:hypothetical protein
MKVSLLGFDQIPIIIAKPRRVRSYPNQDTRRNTLASPRAVQRGGYPVNFPSIVPDAFFRFPIFGDGGATMDVRRGGIGHASFIPHA